MHIVRSASLRGFDELVRSFGGDAAAICRRVDVPIEALQSDELRMPDDGAARAMEIAARELGVPDFGLRLSDYQDLSGLGPLALAIRNASTMGSALHIAQRFLSFHHQGSTLSIEPDPYAARGVEGLRYVSGLRSSSYPQASDNALLNLHRVLVLLANGDYGLRSVELDYAPAAPLSRHESLFGGVRINAGQSLTMLRIPAGVRAHPIANAQATLRELAVYYLNAQTAPLGRQTTVRVRSVIEALLGSGNTNLNEVSAAVDLAPRTLQRRLAAEGSSLGSILDSVRQERALLWLADPKRSMAALSVALELSDQATLSRLGRRWWGITPTAKRTELLSDGGAQNQNSVAQSQPTPLWRPSH